jgi:hypothetical protein
MAPLTLVYRLAWSAYVKADLRELYQLKACQCTKPDQNAAEVVQHSQ